MRFPVCEIENGLYKQPDVSLMQGMLKVIAPRPPEYYYGQQLICEANRNVVGVASLGIARGCAYMISKGADRGRWVIDQAVAAHVDPYLANMATDKTRLQRELTLQSHIAGVLRTESKQQRKAQRRLHLAAVEHLDLTRQESRLARKANVGRAANLLSGRANELEVTALLTRFIHPWFRVAPSLEHEGNQPITEGRNKNYDLLYVEALPGAQEVSAFRVEVKSACFGRCEKSTEQGYRREGLANFQRFRELYVPGISLISICCDIQKPDGMRNVTPLLVSEANSISTDFEALELDTITNGLLLAITAGPGAGIPETIGTN